MQKYDEELLNTIRRFTGFTGDDLKYVTGTVYATIFIGKIPTKKDLAAYMGGCTKAAITQALRRLTAAYVNSTVDSFPLIEWLGEYLPVTDEEPRIRQLIYPIATKLISSGLYLDADEEPFRRAVARLYLETFFKPQLVQSYRAFAGYNTMIDYLWHMTCGEKSHLYPANYPEADREFCKIVSKMDPFMDVIRKSDPQLRLYPTVFDCVMEGFRKIDPLIDNTGSAEIAKARLKKMLLRA